ncbi:MAG: nickel-dependent lactate racemase family protein [Promethearchaeota archaeon]|jgi:nickel-dependent lactate racemase
MKIDYGKDGLEISINPSWDVTIIQPKAQQALIDPVKEIRRAINAPIKGKSLQKIIENKKKVNKVCVVMSDATRPVPSHIILEGLIRELNEYGITDNQILILIATGLHRPSRSEEIERIIGKKLIDRLEVKNHVATDLNSLQYFGITEEHVPIYVNKHYCTSDIKITTGYVEPHFFFGFSGGRKSIIPGIAGIETIQANHSAENISSPFSRFGTYKENVLHKNSIEICKMVGVDFSVNVCINNNHEIVQVAAGDFEKVHETLIDYQFKHVFSKINEPYDIVICGNGGYPLDLNLYQAVKSMALGELAVKKNGTIISVNECSDGIGEEMFKKLLFSGKSPEELYNSIITREIVVPDQWEIQILARILMKTDIFVISKLKEDEIGNIGLKYASNVEEAIKESIKKYGPGARILILPNGPQILPLLS